MLQKSAYKLLEFRNYYSRHRTHTSLEGGTLDQDTSVSLPLAVLHSYPLKRMPETIPFLGS
jgi:hypothetical protein